MITEENLVSVIIPSKNRPEFVQEAIESVLAQTYQNLEVIVVDDGSDVPLASILREKFGGKVNFLRHEVSQGAPTSRNTGIANASGDYIAFLDDDDVWFSDKIEKQLHVISIDPSIGLVFCGEDIVCEEGLVQRREAYWPESYQTEMLMSNVVGGTSVVLIKKELLIENRFDVSLPSCQDWDLFLRLSRLTKFGFVSDVLIERRVHSKQISGDLLKRLNGREKFFNKHRQAIVGEKSAFAQYLRRVGVFYLLLLNRREALCNFYKAFRAEPGDPRNTIFLLFSLLFPISISSRILSRYAVTKIGNYCQYH